MLSIGASSGNGPSLNNSIIFRLLVAVGIFLMVYLLELAFVGSYLLFSLISLWCSRENWRVLEAATAKC
jgi:hypothetical protein